MTKQSFLTLDEFTIQQLRLFPGGTGELSRLLRDIGLASKRINVEVNKAGLQDILGDMGFTNVQGEKVKKLDFFANSQLLHVLRNGMSCAGVCSEEEEDIIIFDDELSKNSKYVVLVDPLDGSSNIDTNVSIGTIFSIFRRVTLPGSPCAEIDFLQPGHQQIAAGYIVYGSSTMLVYATRLGVNGFTLDPSIGEFCLSHPDIHCPEDGSTYSVNEANYNNFSRGIKAYLDALKRENGVSEGTYNLWYVGSMVADLHRTLMKGGVFLYPATKNQPQGKLRLMYESNPFAYIYSRAGGRAINDEIDILDIVPDRLHYRTSLFIGSKNMVERVEQFIRSEKE